MSGLLLTILLFVCISLAQNPVEYELLKKFRKTKDVGIALFLLENYPEAVFEDELRIDLASILLEGGEKERARKVLAKVDLENLRDEYGDKTLKLWKALGLDPKPFVLRFPELVTDMLDRVELTPEEEDKVFSRLIRKRKLQEALRHSKSCFYRGLALYRMRKYEESLEELKECKDKRSAIYALLSYVRLKDLEGAERFVRSKDDPELYFRLGWIFLSLGMYPEARKYFLFSGPDSRSYFYAGVVDFIKGRYLLAYEGFSEAEKFARGNIERARIYFWKAKVSAKLGFEDLSDHYLRLTSEMAGFYSAVARRFLGKGVYEKVDLSYPETNTELADRLITIRKLGFPHYMRLEAFNSLDKFTPADVLKLVKVDPYVAIKVAVRAFGANSDVYKAVAFPTPFEEIVRRVSKKFGVERALIYAVMRQESLFNERALSSSEAKGLMQLIDRTAEWQARRLRIKLEDVYDVETNITLGTAYLRYLLDLWKGDLVKAVASYNAGQGAVGKWIDYEDDFLFIETIPYSETRDYVRKVLWYYYVYSEKLSK